MKIHFEVDLSRYQQQTLAINIEYETGTSQVTLILSALAVGNGIQVTNIRVTDVGGNLVEFTIEQDMLTVNAPHFHLAYEIQTSYTECIGSDKKHELIYPFINAKEIFWGTGVLAYPKSLPEIATEIHSSLQINHLPAGWNFFSNIAEGNFHPVALDGYFVYCSQDQNSHTYQYKGMQGDISFRWLVQEGKTSPISLDEMKRFLASYLAWLERHLDPMRMQSINFLLLQAPDHFEQIANGNSFATGENVINGIAAYMPQSREYLSKFSAHGEYGHFLLEGLAHELMHFYTTTVWQGRFKSRLHPAAECPPSHARLIGETLNLYFCLQYVYRFFEKRDDFLQDVIGQALSTQLKNNRRNPMLDLFLLDVSLRRGRTSLLDAFGLLTRAQQNAAQAYSSAQVLLDAADRLGWSPPAEYPDLLLGDVVPNYAVIVRQALNEIGYSLNILETNQILIKRTR